MSGSEKNRISEISECDTSRVQEETNPGHKLDLIPVDGVTDDRYHFNFTGVRSTLEGRDGIRSRGTSLGSGLVGCEVCLVAGVGCLVPDSLDSFCRCAAKLRRSHSS